ncbi:MAG: amidohydrolase family protein [Candidatus Syntrophopropionicum ammoniitolerans]
MPGPSFEAGGALRVHAHRADDIMTAVRIADEFALDLVIEHCTEGHLVAQKLAAKKVSAVVDPIITNRAKVEMKELTLAAARILDEAGVLLAIMTDHPVVPIQYLAASAALTVKGGLSPDKALQCITINAAKILGLEKRLGSIEPGKDADLVIWDGHPLDISARVTRVYIGGKRILP